MKLNMGKKTGKLTAAVLMTAMAATLPAQAAPLDELNEILERQAALSGSSLLEEELGLEELQRAIGENGLSFYIRTEVDSETGKAFGEEDLLYDGGYADFYGQIDPEEKKWALGGGVGTEEEDILGLDLYGDKELLALSLPQFYAGALALRAGSFREQFLNSGLAQLLEVPESASDIPEFEMTFYPDDSFLEDVQGAWGDFLDELEAKGEELEAGMEVEKTEEGEFTVYTAHVKTGDVMEFYRIVMNAYMDLFSGAGFMSVSLEEAAEAEAQIDQYISEMEEMLGEELPVRFTVKDGLVQKMDYEIFLDTTKLDTGNTGLEIGAEGMIIPDPVSDAADTAEVEAVTEIVEETLAPAGDAADAGPGIDYSVSADSDPGTDYSVSAEAETAEDSFTGYCRYEITFADPENPEEAMDVAMYITDEAGTEWMAMKISKTTSVDGTVSETTVRLELEEAGAVIYSGTPVTVTYDASTGDFDAVFTVSDGEETATMLLDSTFSEVEHGTSFLWTADEISVEAGGEKLGVSGEIRVSAAPGEIEGPGEARFLLEMTRGELLDLLFEMSDNAEAWMARMEGETEPAEDAAEGY